MDLLKIATRNIKRNFYNYFIYFISMIFSIMIYYTFTSIQYNDKVLHLADTMQKVDAGFKAAAFVIAIFAAIFIWYSNSFFTKKRKKEVALYSMLGVKKKQIGRMLFYENMVMGIMALTIGVLLGSLLSKLFLMILVKLMGYSVAVEFTIIPEAIFQTVKTFIILFLITSIHGYTIIYRFKLIDLFKAEKKGEKEPKPSIIKVVLSILFIGGGYWLYLNAFKYKFNFLYVILGTLILVVVGTYFLFSSLTLFIIKLAKRNKKSYYKGINMIGTSQLLYRIKSSSRTLATIAVLSATTLTAMGVVASMYYDFQVKQNKHFPFSYALCTEDKGIKKQIDDTMAKYPENKVIASVDIEFIKTKVLLPEVTKLQDRKSYEGFVHVISESKFNEVAEIRDLEERITLKAPNDIVVLDEHYIKSLMESYNGKPVEISLDNKKTELKIVDFKTYPLINERMAFKTLVVKEAVYNQLYANNSKYVVTAYINDNAKDSEKLTKDIKNIMTQKYSKRELYMSRYSSFYENYFGWVSMFGLMIFIAGFLGLVFLLATGSIIFFKQLSEANDDKPRYELLKKIGVGKKEIKMSIAKQILFVFITPLIVGIIHSIVAVSFFGKVLNINLVVPLGVSIGAYTLIYMVYYMLTVNSYSKIVSSNI